MRTIIIFELFLFLWGKFIKAADADGRTDAYHVAALLASMREKNLRAEQGGYAEGPINVTVGISVRKIMEVNDKMQTVRVKVWFRQSWINKHAAWNASERGGINRLVVDPHLLWNPEIVLYNSVDTKYSGGMEKYKTDMVAMADGSIHWKSPAVYEFSCPLNIRYFPFDEQTCYLTFGSWIYDLRRVDLRKEVHDQFHSEFIEGVTWQLVSIQRTRNVVQYDCCPNPFVDMQFSVTIRRKPLYYIVTIIIPSLLILSLTIVSFFLPPDCGERVGLTVTIFLTVTFFMEITNRTLPVYSINLPLLSMFFLSVMAISIASAFTTGLVLLAHFKGTNKSAPSMPNWVRRIFIQKIGRYFVPEEVKEWEKEIEDKQMHFMFGQAFSLKGEPTPRGSQEIALIGRSQSSFDDPWSIVKEGLRSRNPVEIKALAKLLTQLMNLTDNLKQKDVGDYNEREWRLLASLIDRILLIILSTSSILLSFGFLYEICARRS